MKMAATIAVVAVVASMGQAAVTIDTSLADPQQAIFISTSPTFGDMMDGMIVTANGSDSALWAGTGVGAGGAGGTGWSLSETGDTYEGFWTLTSEASLTSLAVDAGAGNTLFDILESDFYTPGSSTGRPFTLVSAGAYTGDIDVTYRGPISLVGEPFQGDLYRYMDIAFSTPFSGTLVFAGDTDNVTLQGDTTPVIPAPGALVLASIGSALVGLLRRRRAV